MIQIVIDRKTPTINHLYYHKGNIKVLSNEGRELRKYIEKKVSEQINGESVEKLKNKKLSLTVEIFENWYTKKGVVRKKDLANREKFLIDSVFRSLGLDDCYIFEHTMFKIQSGEEKVVINIIPTQQNQS
jgi:Holliday junction resolvase RusA-like endonuclease